LNRYWVETKIRISGVFVDDVGNPADPTTVTLTIKEPQHQPDLVVTPVRDGVGLYHYDTVIGSAGIWTYQWQGEGDLIAASPVNLIQAF
jgi:hypothetical protein